MAGRGRPHSYTAQGLKKAVDRYFAAITRTVRVTERIDRGDRDSNGHVIWSEEPVINNLGEEVYRTEYILPPSVGGLCASLKIDRSTWAAYGDAERNPEHARIIEAARERMREWNENELVTREGKNVKGIIFNLENNYGYKEQRSMELGGAGIEEFLNRLSENEEGAEL